MKFYAVLVRLFRFFSRLYFVELRSTGKERIPEKGPVMLAANHPSSLLDTILLAIEIRRPIHYLARSGLFRHPVLAAFFRNLGAIPIYRPEEVQDSAHRNTEVFDRVYELFERGGCIGIFPEGRNSPWARVAQLRKGGARMALGAEARNDWKLGLVIVPVGLYFESREFFLSKVLLRFGEPIRVADYQQQYQTGPAVAVQELTTAIQRSLRRQALHTEDEKLRELADELVEALGHRPELSVPRVRGSSPDDSVKLPWYRRWMKVLLHWYTQSSQQESEAFEKRTLSREYINDILAQATQSDPEAVDALRNQLARYKDHLRQTRLREAIRDSRALDQPVKDRLVRLRMTLYALFMAPLALFGVIHNAVPYLLTRTLARLSKDDAVRAFSYFGFGFLLFIGAYAGFGLWLWYGTGLGLFSVVLYLAFLPPTGFVALHYRKNILRYRHRILVRTFFWDNEELARLLRHERQLLIDHLEALAEQ